MPSSSRLLHCKAIAACGGGVSGGFRRAWAGWNEGSTAGSVTAVTKSSRVTITDLTVLAFAAQSVAVLMAEFLAGVRRRLIEE